MLQMMKLLLISFLCFFSFSLFSQSVSWEEVASLDSLDAKIIFQSKLGHIICVNQNLNYYIKDNKDKQWHQITFDDGTNGKVFFVEDSNNIIYAFSNNSKKIYKSVNNIHEFKELQSVNSLIVYDFKIKNDIIYIVSSNEVFVYDIKKTKLSLLFTPSLIQSWFNAELIIGNNDVNYIIYDINVSDGRYINVIKFYDSGANEKLSNPSFFYYSDIHFLKSGKLIARDKSNLVITPDGGITTNILVCPTNNANSKYWKLLVNSANEIIVAVENDIFFSNDEGNTWIKELSPKISKDNVNLLNQNLNELIFATDYFCFISNNKAQNWQSINFKSYLSSVKNIALTSENEIILNGNIEHLHLKINSSIDLSNNYEYRFNRIFHSSINNYIAYDSKYLKWFKSINKGKTWNVMEQVPLYKQWLWSSKPNIIPIDIKFENPKLIYGIYKNIFYSSKDEGESWKTTILNEIDSTKSIDKTFLSDNKLYIYHNKKIKYFDIDKNQLFEIVLPNNTNKNSWVLNMFVKNNLLYIVERFNNGNGNKYNLYISSDLGKNFSIVKLPVNNFNPIVNVDNMNNIYLLTNNQCYYSTNQGMIWEDFTNMITDLTKIWNYLISDDGYLYYFEENKLYKSNTKITESDFWLIKGNLFMDKNSNCTEDSNDVTLKNYNIKFGNYVRTTDQFGAFNFVSTLGKYDANVLIDPYFYKICDNTKFFTIDSSNVQNPISILIEKKRDCSDLEIKTATQVLRRCFKNTTEVEIKNIGTKIASKVEITILLDSFYEFISTTLPIISQNGQKIVLDAGNINENQSIKFNYSFIVSCNSLLGQNHCTKIYASSPDNCNDPTRLIKTYNDCMINIGAFDPNDKTVFVNGKQNESHAKENQSIEYLIRFQNTGTDTAFNITVVDTLHKHLDVNNLELGLSSHLYDWEVRNKVLFIYFRNIMLPDSNKNEKLSHGYIKFKITPNKQVTYSDLISNRAAIYFDFNEPIITNEVFLNKNIINVKEKEIRDSNFEIYPNPGFNELNIEYNDENLKDVKFEIYSIDGIKLMRQDLPLKNTKVDISNLNTGLYLIKFSSREKSEVKKLMKI